MTQLRLGKEKAIEPTSVEKGRPGERFLRDPEARQQTAFMNSYMSTLFERICAHDPIRRDINPDFVLRSLGYTRDPSTCSHIKKQFKTRWICSECGADC